ncbi:hypothetical protein [Pseudomonas typographi]|uniref:Secreted protein n=1 Tax=Pseudomonas typographi TaxID=2715964 RepID=A0ABR7YWB0_9PSED|nr:hypothetical protein [Pseudomonas typographi]MBD1585617.1 hypothetical protein [Pseudomonas typographi]MBD1597470.1 hypothetical protein [Pseudomonas typographi]
MRLHIARASFVLLALAVTGVAMAAWHQPEPEILSTAHGEGACPLPRAKDQAAVKPDQDLLLLVFGLAQGSRGQH